MTDEKVPVIPPRGGLMHAVDATRYSAAGFRRLMHESAARLELMAGALVCAALLWRGVDLVHWMGFGVLAALVLVVESLNTAIEEVVDHLSPDWSEMARNAKDLGSLAVGLMLAVTGVYCALVLMRLI